MDPKHLTEKDIQMYLDGIPHQKETFKIHLEECRQCRNLLVQYQKLYQVLCMEPEQELSSQFVENVMLHSNIKEKPESLYSFKELIILTTITILTLVILFVFFIDIKPFINTFSNLDILPKSVFDILAPQIKEWLAPLNGNYSVFV